MLRDLQIELEPVFVRLKSHDFSPRNVTRGASNVAAFDWWCNLANSGRAALFVCVGSGQIPHHERTQKPTPAVPYDPLRLPEYQVDQYVVPVLSAAPDDKATLHGTAFSISDGVFLTAGHIIEAARSAAAQSEGKIWLSMRIADSDAGANHEILSTEFPPLREARLHSC